MHKFASHKVGPSILFSLSRFPVPFLSSPNQSPLQSDFGHATCEHVRTDPQYNRNVRHMQIHTHTHTIIIFLQNEFKKNLLYTLYGIYNYSITCFFVRSELDDNLISSLPEGLSKLNQLQEL